MELIKLRGRTYYIHAPTNIGVYRYKNNFSTLIDTGIDNTAGRRILDVLESEGLKVKYIVNTHSHPDHFGANNFIKENHTGTQIAASRQEKLFMENSNLESITLYGAAPMPGLSARFVKARESPVDIVLDEGHVDLGGKKFEILPLKGHSVGQIGVVTEDNVIFCGDTFFSEEIIEKYPFPFLFDVGQQIETLKHLLSTDYDIYVISHCEGVPRDPKGLIQKNLDNIDNNLEVIMGYLVQPLTREDLVELMVQRCRIPMNVPQYFITMTSVSAFLTYLLQSQAISMDIIDGKMYFYV